MEHRLNCRLSVLGSNLLTGELRHQLARRFGSNRLKLAASSVGRGPDLLLGLGDALADLCVDRLQALLGIESGPMLCFLRDLQRLATADVDALAIGFLGSFRLFAGALGGREVVGDLLVSVFHDRLDLRHHSAPDPEVDDAEHDHQPEQLAEEDVGKLIYLRHRRSRLSGRTSRPVDDQRA